ncbi:FecR domain-containing protein [Echinicola marina]|uniref:FecR family protein n=1 Tax=Echinicola marina TaxID=2859768 RepID=UPI001CF6A317|nr:FecR domain-containing protein [Echinicola marina]UCS95474.1 FecR domain-containing protein [Echinicola marina]
MKAYNKIEDLLFDQSFKDWVLQGEPLGNLKWKNWISQNEDNRLLYEQAKAILISLNDQGEIMDAAMQSKLFNRIENSIQTKSRNQLPHEKYSIWNQAWFRAAAILLLVVGLSIALSNIKTIEKETLVEEVGRVVKSNPMGQKSKLYLPDGTIVYLNSGSEIVYQENFGKSNRDIDLNGEAFFEVAHDTLLPFRVKSRNMMTVAVGTSFNIKAYQEDTPSIQLATGKVRVYSMDDEEKEVFLDPGEEASLGSVGLEKGKFDRKNAFGWKEGVLSFTQMRFSEVKQLLERWYAVEITVNNSPKKDEKVSGEYKDAILENVLKSLGYTMGFDFKIDRKKITIYFNTNANE